MVVVVVVDSLEHELEEEYPDGETESGVRLRGDPGDGDVRRSISSLRLRFAGVGVLFLTGLKEDPVWVSSTEKVFCTSFADLRNLLRSVRDSMDSLISRRRSCSCWRISRKSPNSR